MSINSLFTLVNMGAAAWLVVSAIAALHHKVDGRDPRPLVMPIFCGLAFFFLAFTWIAKDAEQYHESLTLLAWQMVHFGMLVGLQLFVRAFSGHRG
jgi:apolipoprotein N-acyltransferase